MRSFIYSLIFSTTCMLALQQAQAQKKQTIYYPNGKVAEEARRMPAGDVNAIDPGLAPREEIFKTVQQMPQAGYNFNQYISKNLKAPKNIDVSRGTRVIVEFVVRKDGSIDKVRAIRSEKVNPALVAEVIKVVQQMPKWKPGMQNGKAVDVTLTYPVQVELQ